MYELQQKKHSMEIGREERRNKLGWHILVNSICDCFVLVFCHNDNAACSSLSQGYKDEKSNDSVDDDV